MKIRIYYEDTDAGGVVYHANYLKFCERQRSELFFQKGMSPSMDDAHFVVKHIEADFIKPAFLGDLVEVRHEILEIKNASLRMHQSVWLKDVKLFEITSLLAFVKEGKPKKIPQEMKEFFVDFKTL